MTSSICAPNSTRRAGDWSRSTSADPVLRGREIVAQHDTDVLVDARPAAGSFALLWSADAAHRVEIVDRAGAHRDWPELPAPISVTALNSRDRSTEIFVGVTSFTTPGQVVSAGPRGARRRPCPRCRCRVPRWPCPQSLSSAATVVSADGTAVPMTVLRRADLPAGPRATLLYGYGGFDIPVLPSFSAMFATWVAVGGVLAVANLRGGGEFGADWHKAGMLHNKQNVFDDLFGCAHELIDSGVTTPAQLAVHGRSNGGLLVGAAMTQHPELFAAALPTVGVLDMLRFHLFTIGWAWTTDYGTPEDAADFEVLRGVLAAAPAGAGYVVPAHPDLHRRPRRPGGAGAFAEVRRRTATLPGRPGSGAAAGRHPGRARDGQAGQGAGRRVRRPAGLRRRAHRAGAARCVRLTRRPRFARIIFLSAAEVGYFCHASHKSGTFVRAGLKTLAWETETGVGDVGAEREGRWQRPIRPSASASSTAVGFRSERGPILISLMLSTSLVALDSTIVATAVPSIVGDLGGFSQFPWLFSVYLLAQAVSVPVYGKLADLFGRKPIMLFGIGLFLFGSILCGFAWSMPALIAFRAVQGLGAGAVQPMSVTIAGDIYTLAERAKAQGYLASVWAISAVVGPDPRRAVRAVPDLALDLLRQHSAVCAGGLDADPEVPRAGPAAGPPADRLPRQRLPDHRLHPADPRPAGGRAGLGLELRRPASRSCPAVRC